MTKTDRDGGGANGDGSNGRQQTVDAYEAEVNRLSLAFSPLGKFSFSCILCLRGRKMIASLQRTSKSECVRI